MDIPIKSRLLKDFIKEITYCNRNPRDIRALQLLNDISTNPEQVLKPNEKLYRCRIIKSTHQVGKEAGFFGLNAKDSFVAPVASTRDMRANYRYIPYLYCTNSPYVAIVETRPRLGACVSLATLIVKEELTLLDFTNKFKPSKISDAKTNLFADLSYLFSKPIAEEDDVTDYIPTQFIAEYAKNLDYDGIVFKSSLVPEFGEDDELQCNNIVVFNYNKCEPIKSNILKITSCQIDAKQIDDDPDKLTIQSLNSEIIDILFGNKL